MPELKFGTAINSVVHTDADNFSVDERFRMVKEAGVFDYIEKTPPTGELEVYQAAVQKHGIPLRTGGWYYSIGRDEPLLDWHLRICKTLGSTAMNIGIRTMDVNGRLVPDEKIADIYCWAAELGDKNGVTPCFETHINQWSEHFGRVVPVGEIVEKRGVKFNITLDHSHVMFKIDNPREQEVQNLRADVEAGRVELDPFKPNDVCSQWIARNYVAHAHARAAVPNNPINIWGKNLNGSPGRGVQYPFLKPKPGDWHAEWDETRLEPWKEVLRRLMTFHATDPKSCLDQISTEFLASPDYGGGAKYSVWENSIAAAKWLRATWAETLNVALPRA